MALHMSFSLRGCLFLFEYETNNRHPITEISDICSDLLGRALLPTRTPVSENTQKSTPAQDIFR